VDTIMKISARINRLEASETVAFTERIQALRREGRAIIDLAVGVPGIPPGPLALEATREALALGRTRYDAVAGLYPLRRDLARQLPGCDPEQVVISNGAKQALFQVFQALLDPGDEVVIPQPSWVSFSRQVELAGGRPVFVPTRDHRPDLTAMARAVTAHTRALLINSPNNPTGAVYTREEVDGIVSLCRSRDLVLISDEAYDGFVYDGREVASPYAWEEARDRLVVVRSFSKRYGMSGFRVGWAVAPPALAAALVKLQGHLTGNVCTFSQYGALAALAAGEPPQEELQAAFQARRDLALEAIGGHMPCITPHGSFYLFPEVRAQAARFGSSAGLARHWLETAGVAVVPGEAFGGPGHVRISFGGPEADLREGLERIRRLL
jgi:aspartate aminotransferase